MSGPLIESQVTPNAYVEASGKEVGTLVTPAFDTFFRNHEKMLWGVGEINFKAIRKDLLTPDDTKALIGGMLVESHNPVFTSQLMEYYRADHEMTSFLPVWGYEEMKHYVFLRTYLEAIGVDKAELEGVLNQTRSGPWGETEAKFTPVQALTYTMVQEQTTNIFYNRFANRTQEPVLRKLLTLLGKDEMRHCQYYLVKGKEEIAKDRHVLDQVDEVLINFAMPGDSFVPDYGKHQAAMIKVTNPGPVETGMVVNKIKELVGTMHGLKLMTNPAVIRRLTGWGGDKY